MYITPTFLSVSHHSLVSLSMDGAWRFAGKYSEEQKHLGEKSVFQFWFCGNKIHSCFMPGNVFGKWRQFTGFLIRALVLYKVSQDFSLHCSKNKLCGSRRHLTMVLYCY